MFELLWKPACHAYSIAGGVAMYKVTDRSSVQPKFSIPAMLEACSLADHWLSEPRRENDEQPWATAQLDPLYLFGCSLLWHKQEDAAAAWELIHGLHSADQGTRTMASALLTKRRTPRERGAAQAGRIPSSPKCGA